MREYVLSRRCRRRILLGYLGEEISTKGGLPWPVTFGRFTASSNGFCSRVILTRLLKQAHVRSARTESKQGEGQSARPELVAADGRGCFTPGTTCKNSTSVFGSPSGSSPNGIVPEDAVMNAQTLPMVMTPARGPFVENRRGGSSLAALLKRPSQGIRYGAVGSANPAVLGSGVQRGSGARRSAISCSCPLSGSGSGRPAASLISSMIS